MRWRDFDRELEERWTTCWKCDAAINWGFAQRCPDCWWAICRTCNACRRPMATSPSTKRRGPCPREIPLFADTLSLRWARDHNNNPINWATHGQKGPSLITPNADPALEWITRLRKEFRLPTVSIDTRGLAAGYGSMIRIANKWDVLHDPRAVELMAMALEHQPGLGVTLEAVKDRVSARLGKPAYALVAGQMYESVDNVSWDLLDELEDHRQGWAEVMV